MSDKTRTIKIGDFALGGGNPVLVQSMLSVHSKDINGNVQQAVRLEKAGCQIVRVSVPTLEDVVLIAALKKAVCIPVVADIHFDYRIALACAETGASKIRINPGNIGSDDKIKAVADICKAKNIPIRIGVNGGSLEKDILEKYKTPTAEALVESALKNITLLEKHEFYNIVVSIKSSHVPTNVAAYRMLSKKIDYPLHLGVTEAGTYRMGVIKNAVGIGSLLLDGIGDTLRVSLTDEPEKEVRAGFDILRTCGYPVTGPEIISCPTCGRTNIGVAKIADELEKKLADSTKNIKVAVMGCVVNGLGEGKEADIGIAGGIDSAVLFIKGERIRTLYGNYVEELVKEIEKI